MATNDPGGRGTTSDTKKNWIPWVIGGLLLLVILIFAMRGCGEVADESPSNATTDQAVVDPNAIGAAGSGAGIGTATGDVGTGGTVVFTREAVRGYLGGSGADATGRAFALDRVTFDSGSSTLDPAGQGVLGEVAEVLREHPNATATITSYADPEGDAAANRKLAAARAVSVKDALAAAGVPAGQLMTNVVGETGTAPLAINRRVELLIQRP